MADLTKQQEKQLDVLMEKARDKAIEALQEERTEEVDGKEVTRKVYTRTVGEAQAAGAKAAAEVSQKFKKDLEDKKAKAAMKEQEKKRAEERKEWEKTEKERKQRNKDIRDGKDEEPTAEEPAEDTGVEPGPEDKVETNVGDASAPVPEPPKGSKPTVGKKVEEKKGGEKGKK